MVKEKLKELIKEYKEIGDELAQCEAEYSDYSHEGNREKALFFRDKTDVLAKNLYKKYDEIMEFIEENV